MSATIWTFNVEAYTKNLAGGFGSTRDVHQKGEKRNLPKIDTILDIVRVEHGTNKLPEQPLSNAAGLYLAHQASFDKIGLTGITVVALGGGGKKDYSEKSVVCPTEISALVEDIVLRLEVFKRECPEYPVAAESFPAVLELCENPSEASQ